jgi:hypothetical protein
MKKSLIAVATLLVIIALLPILGNSVIQKTIDERVSTFTSYGIETTKNEIHSSYLHSSRHFEFLLKDSKKFVKYLSQYSEQQIPPYVDALFDGVLIGADVEYSNLPFAKAVKMELYPVALSVDVAERLKVEDIELYNYVENLFSSKAILYHINYNFLNDDFDGYLKDIDENYITKDDVNIKLLLQKASFSGNGKLLAPQRLSSKLKKLVVHVSKGTKEVQVSLKKFSTKSNFESQSTYLSSADVKSILVVVQGTQSDLRMQVDKARVNVSVDSLGETSALNSKTTVENFSIKSDRLSLDLKKLNMDVVLSELNKLDFERVQLLMSKLQLAKSSKDELELEQTVLKLISSGFVFNIADFSIKSLIMNNRDFQGFKVTSTLTLKEDKALAQKIQQSPLFVLQDIKLDTNIKISKMIYGLLVQNQGMLANLHTYAKEIGDSYLFDIKFADSKVSINGKALN